jgi:hypothetical protein
VGQRAGGRPQPGGYEIKEYVEQFLPGFDEHYERAQRSVSAEPHAPAGRILHEDDINSRFGSLHTVINGPVE